MNFCSNCVYAKEIENADGIWIVCTRLKAPSSSNWNAKYWSSTRQMFKKLNSRACVSYKDKDVTENR